MPTEFHPLNLFWNSRYIFLNIAKDCLLKRFSHIYPSLTSWWISMNISRIQSKWLLEDRFLCSQFTCTPLISLLFFMPNYVTTGKDWCWERLKAGGEGDDRGWDGWRTSPTWWTWVWISSESWCRGTGKPGVLQSMGSQRVRHNWATELMSQCIVFI